MTIHPVAAAGRPGATPIPGSPRRRPRDGASPRVLGSPSHGRRTAGALRAAVGLRAASPPASRDRQAPGRRFLAVLLIVAGLVLAVPAAAAPPSSPSTSSATSPDLPVSLLSWMEAGVDLAAGWLRQVVPGPDGDDVESGAPGGGNALDGGLGPLVDPDGYAPSRPPVPTPSPGAENLSHGS